MPGNVFDEPNSPLFRKPANPTSVDEMVELTRAIRASQALRNQLHDDPVAVMDQYNVPWDFLFDNGNQIAAVMVVDSEIGVFTLTNHSAGMPIYYLVVPATPPGVPGSDEFVFHEWEDAWNRATTTTYGM